MSSCASTSSVEEAQLVRMLELQRFAEFGRLSAHLIHEVANPLTAAALHLELLGKDQSKTIRQIRKNIRQLELYVNAARKQLKMESQPRPFRVTTEMNHCLAILKPIAQRSQVRLVATIDNNQTRLYGDPIKFSQVFANIVVNAIDAYAEYTCPTSRRKININVACKGDYLNLRVEDWAGGIEPEQLAQIFEPFYTTKADSPRGLGIGLSLVKQYVEVDFGGRISVKSSMGRGTVFSIQFALQASPLTPSKPSAVSRRAPALQPAV